MNIKTGMRVAYREIETEPLSIGRVEDVSEGGFCTVEFEGGERATVHADHLTEVQ